MSKLHLVFGGRVKDPRGLDFDMNTIDLVGVYDSYAAAEDAWRGKAQGTVDEAEMKYVVAHLHRLLDPEETGRRRAPRAPRRTRGGEPPPPRPSPSNSKREPGPPEEIAPLRPRLCARASPVDSPAR